jgi:hypothetical protein
MKFLNIAILSLTLLGLTFVSCESTADSIETDKLETVCDHVNALDDVTGEMLDRLGMDKPKDLEGDDKTQYDKLHDKMEEVQKAMKKRFKTAEIKDCPGYDVVKRKMKDLK